LDQKDLIDWARIEANRLRTVSNNPQVNSGDAGRAVEFLRLHAGSQSHFYTRAVQIIKDGVPAYAIRNVASLLEGWADLVEAGLIEAPFEARAKVDAATDLMEQVHILLDDRKVHPAAPVMLAGAALEEFLRSMLVVSNSQAKGKPSINSYAAALREAEVLTAQDLKDVTAWGGMRNDAAHGHFGAVTIDRARIMVDGINLFMRQKST
jgi:hypothetical protein